MSSQRGPRPWPPVLLVGMAVDAPHALDPPRRPLRFHGGISAALREGWRLGPHQRLHPHGVGLGQPLLLLSYSDLYSDLLPTASLRSL